MIAFLKHIKSCKLYLDYLSFLYSCKLGSFVHLFCTKQEQTYDLEDYILYQNNLLQKFESPCLVGTKETRSISTILLDLEETLKLCELIKAPLNNLFIDIWETLENPYYCKKIVVYDYTLRRFPIYSNLIDTEYYVNSEVWHKALQFSAPFNPTQNKYIKITQALRELSTNDIMCRADLMYKLLQLERYK